VKKYKEISDYYTSITNEFLDATFVKNHDQIRILSELNGNVEKAKLAAGILFTLPGTPYIYQGEEIGMIGLKEDMDRGQRESFIWAEGSADALQSNWYPARFSTDKTVIPYAKQKDNPESIYNYYKKFINYRNSSAPLTQGSIALTNLTVKEVVSFVRAYQAEEELVLHNLSDVEITVALKDSLAKYKSIAFSTKGGSLRDGDLAIPAYGSIILK
jgi:glycosidase